MAKIKKKPIILKTTTEMSKTVPVNTDIHALREEYVTSLELVAKLNNWKSGYNKLNDYRLREQLTEVINHRLKELNKRIIKIEEVLHG